MKSGTGFASGRPTNAAKGTTSVLRYLPTQRRPWLPHRFGMRNLNESDATKLWSAGRFSGGMTWTGYSTNKTHKLHDETVNIIPAAELERFMPNINIGSKSWVTPVTLMNARDGQRITHDLIHSYDKYIGRNKPGLEKPEIDHDNITVHDPNRVGLHGDTMSCRSQIYRWLRRAPFKNETEYFFSNMLKEDARVIVESEAEKPLIKKVIRLANTGQLKLACEEYRRLTFIPPVEVYRALLNACVPHGMIGDAVSIYEEGNHLKGMSRDYECLRALLRTAIEAENVERVMWVFSLVRGDWTTNVLKRTPIEPIYASQLHVLALEYLCDRGYDVEARTVYKYLKDSGMLEMDLNEVLGLQLRAAIEKGEVANLPSNLEGVSTQSDATRIAPVVAETWVKRLKPHELAAFGATPPAATATVLYEAFDDIDVSFVLRTARLKGEIDLLATNQVESYVDRVLAWCELLSNFHRKVDAPLPYLVKTKASAGSQEHVRIAADPRAPSHTGPGRMLPSQSGYAFWYRAKTSRFIQETYPTLHDGTATRRALVRDPIQTDVPVAIADLRGASRQSTIKSVTPRVVHKSVSGRQGSAVTIAPSGGTAQAVAAAAANTSGMKF